MTTGLQAPQPRGAAQVNHLPAGRANSNNTFGHATHAPDIPAHAAHIGLVLSPLRSSTPPPPPVLEAVTPR